MKAVKKPIIQSDKKMDDTMKYGSLNLYLDTSFRPEHHRRQWGIMVSDFKDLKKGEKVYFHYLSLVDDPHIPPNKWLIDYYMLYCVIRDNKIVMLNDYLLVSIVDEEINSNLITLKKKATNKGIVRHSNHPMLNEGDEILFRDINAFVNVIEGEELYLMENRDVLKVVKNG